MGGDLIAKLLMCLVLGTLLFTLGCKQSNTKDKPKPILSNEITITVQGDSNCTVAKLNEIKVKKNLNLTWKEIKLLASSIITLAKDKEIKEWRLNNAEGAVLKDTDKFEKDTTVFAVSQKKQENSPSTNEEITITVQGDSSCIVAKLNEIKVKKNLNLTWKEIMLLASSIITLPQDKEIKEWRLTNADGAVLKDTDKFEKDTTVFAVTKNKPQEPAVEPEVIITVKGDAGCTIGQFKEIKVKKNLNLTWKNIKKSAEALITLNANKEIKEWRLTNADGAVIEESKTFAENATVFAITKNKENVPPTPTIVLTVKADSGFTFKETTTPCTIEVEKGSTWASIKEKAEAKIEIKEEYEKTGWKLGGKNGSKIEDDTVFNGNQIIYASSKKKGEPETPKIVITVRGDEGVEIGSPDNFKVEKGSEWVDIKTQAEEKAKPKDNYEIIEWHLGDTSGTVLNDWEQFNENKTEYAKTKQIRQKVSYKVQHFKEELNGSYKIVEEDTEEKEGLEGDETQAVAKTYEGFTVANFKQKKIQSNGKTVVIIRYQRNIVSLIIDLAGGETDTNLEDGANGKKLLKGKFGVEVRIKDPTKNDVQFDRWEPALPTHFPANDATVYVAQWVNKTEYRVTVKGDERVKISEPDYVNVSIDPQKTFGAIKSDLTAKVSFADGWSSEEYVIYDWRIGDENGEEMLDSTPITKDITVYARTNYNKFRLNGTTLEGYSGEKPRGRIFLPKEIEVIEHNAFYDCSSLKTLDLSNCVNLTSIGEDAFNGCESLKELDLSKCTNLTSIGENAFRRCEKLESIDLSAFADKLEKIEESTFHGCESLKTLDLSNCTNITSIAWGAFSGCSSLKTLDLSNCTNLTSIGESAFSGCKELESIDLSACTNLQKLIKESFDRYGGKVKLPASITEIEKYAFGEDSYYLSSQVLVPNETIKELVMDSGYPEDRIKLY